jgi:hypothetical protein
MRARRLTALARIGLLAAAAALTPPLSDAVANATTPHPIVLTALPAAVTLAQAREPARSELELAPKEMREPDGWSLLEMLLIAAALGIAVAIVVFVIRHHRTGRAG